MEKDKTPQNNKHFWDFVTPSGEKPAELILYGDISSTSWWGDEITPRQFSEELKGLGDIAEIVVRINSGGGDVFAANAIYTRLKDHPAHITVKIDGWCGSAATIIAMAGDVVMIPGAGAFMLHDPAMGVRGYYHAADFTKLAQELEVIKNCIVNAYALKTGKNREEIAELMAAETWYTGTEAVENGFCDELMFEDVQTQVENGAKVLVNSVSMDISRFQHFPQRLVDRLQRQEGGLFHSGQSQKKEEKVMELDMKTVGDLKAAFPDLIKQIEDSAAESERKRIQDIEGVAMEGFDDLVRAAKFEKPVAAADVAMQIIAKQKEQARKFLNDREADVQGSKMKEVGRESTEGVGTGRENPFDKAVDQLYPKTK